MAKPEKTVRDIHREAISLKADNKNRRPAEVIQELLRIGHMNGYKPRVSATDPLEINFDTGEAIYFDQASSEWRHRAA